MLAIGQWLRDQKRDPAQSPPSDIARCTHLKGASVPQKELRRARKVRREGGEGVSPQSLEAREETRVLPRGREDHHVESRTTSRAYRTHRDDSRGPPRDLRLELGRLLSEPTRRNVGVRQRVETKINEYTLVAKG